MRTRSAPKPINEASPEIQGATSTAETTGSKAQLRPAPLTRASSRAATASTASSRITKPPPRFPIPDNQNIIGLRSRDVWPGDDDGMATQGAQQAWKGKGKTVGAREKRSLGITGQENRPGIETTERTTRASTRAQTSRQSERELNDNVPGAETILRAASTAMASATTPSHTAKRSVMFNTGLPTPSLTDAGSVNGDVTGKGPAGASTWSRDRLRRVSFANPIEMPPSPTPSYAAPTKTSSARQKRKLSVSSASSYEPAPKRPAKQRTSKSSKPAVEIECTICAETKPKYRNFPTAAQLPNCDHPRDVCITCITTYTTNTLKSKGVWSAVTCPQCTVLFTSTQVLAVVRRRDAAKLQKIAKQKAIERDQNYHYCPNPDCGNGQIYKQPLNPAPMNVFDPFGHQYNEINLSICKKCKGRSCFRHKMVWHEGYSCERYEDSHPDAEVKRTNDERLRKVVKKCPGKGCTWYVEKDGGCGHMYCTRCQISWNWNDVEYYGNEKKSKGAAAGEGSSAGAGTIAEGANPVAEGADAPQIPPQNQPDPVRAMIAANNY